MKKRINRAAALLTAAAIVMNAAPFAVYAEGEEVTALSEEIPEEESETLADSAPDASAAETGQAFEAFSSDRESGENNMAYAAYYIGSEELGIGYVFFTDELLSGELSGSIVDPADYENYSSEELTALKEGGADEEAPEGAVLGIGVYGENRVFWYDADAAAEIFRHSEALTLDPSAGTLTGIIASPLSGEASSETDKEDESADLKEEETTWAYAAYTLDSEGLGIGTVYYTEAFYKNAVKSGALDPQTLSAYTKEQAEEITEGAEDAGEGYRADAPADAVLGISAYGSDAVYWYDAAAAAEILSHSEALAMQDGRLYGTVADSRLKGWGYGIELDLQEAGIGSVYYTDSYFSLASDLVLYNPLTGEDYTAEEIEAVRADALYGAEGYISGAPDGAVIGISVYGNGKGYWYDETAARAMVAHEDILSLNAENGELTDAEGNVIAKALEVPLEKWAYGIAVNSKERNIGTVYLASAWFEASDSPDGETMNPVSKEAFTQDEIDTILAGALSDAGDSYIVDVPDGFVLGITTWDGKTIFWYDEASAEEIAAYSGIFVLDGRTGELAEE